MDGWMDGLQAGMEWQLADDDHYALSCPACVDDDVRSCATTGITT